jgi:hypothetical protein
VGAAAARDPRRRTRELVQEIVRALGGVKYLALECDVSTWTVRAWMTGARLPAPANRRRIALLARDFGLTAERSGRYRKSGSGGKKSAKKR